MTALLEVTALLEYLDLFQCIFTEAVDLITSMVTTPLTLSSYYNYHKPIVTILIGDELDYWNKRCVGIVV